MSGRSCPPISALKENNVGISEIALIWICLTDIISKSSQRKTFESSSKLMPLILYLPRILLGKLFLMLSHPSFYKGEKIPCQVSLCFVSSHLPRFSEVNIQQNSSVFFEHNSSFIQLRPFCDHEKTKTVVSYSLHC